MKSTLCLLIAFAGVALSSNVPTFSWLEDQFSPSGVPLLSINFHDGKPDDVAILNQFNPIPRKANEREENVDKCIFNGYLRDEPKVYVTLTGGCPFSKAYDVMFASERTTEFKFQVRDFITTVIPSVFNAKGNIFDEARVPPATIAKSFKNPERVPGNAYTLKVEIKYDLTFESYFGGDAPNVARRVAAHATNLYTWPTLDIPLTWSVSNYNVIPESGVNAIGGWLDYLGYKYNNPNVNSNVYLGYTSGDDGVIGLAVVGTICSTAQYRTAVVEYVTNDMNTGEIMAHEVGHNTGMDHDFLASGGDRFDSQGRPCTHIGGVMDYVTPMTRWSTCSNEDFQRHDYSCL